MPLNSSVPPEGVTPLSSVGLDAPETTRPLPPLDGYHVLNDMLLKRPLFATPEQARIGQGILLVLVMTRVVEKVLSFCTGYMWDALINVVLRVLAAV